MITPVLIKQISWGTYLLFGALNACFIPIIYFFYPETAGRSLEEIDLIFAKGYTEKMSYVHAAKQLPAMNDEATVRPFGQRCREPLRQGIFQGETQARRRADASGRRTGVKFS
jgi:hypothetical protein